MTPQKAKFYSETITLAVLGIVTVAIWAGFIFPAFSEARDKFASFVVWAVIYFVVALLSLHAWRSKEALKSLPSPSHWLGIAIITVCIGFVSFLFDGIVGKMGHPGLGLTEAAFRPGSTFGAGFKLLICIGAFVCLIGAFRLFIEKKLLQMKPE